MKNFIKLLLAAGILMSFGISTVSAQTSLREQERRKREAPNRAKLDWGSKTKNVSNATHATVGTSKGVPASESMVRSASATTVDSEATSSAISENDGMGKYFGATPSTAATNISLDYSGPGGDSDNDRLKGLGYIYGNGVEKDVKKGLKLLGKAVNAGNTEAQYDVGVLYRDGVGVKRSYSDAAAWFRKAGRNGNAKAQYEAGRLFYEGLGVQQDSRIAAEWFWRAAEGGSPEGAYMYAKMLKEGKGVEKDLRKAYKWFAKAAESQYSDAGEQAASLSAYKPKAQKKHSVGGRGNNNKKAHGQNSRGRRSRK